MTEEQKKIEQALRDGSARFEDIYLTYYRGIYNYIYGFMGHREKTEDLTADVFVSAYRNLSQLDLSRGSFSAWIYSIARNAVRDHRKRAAFRCEVLGDVPEKADFSAPFAENGGIDDSLKNPENIWLQQILERLSDEEKDLLILRYQTGLSNQEVGAVLGLSIDAVSKRYSRLLLKCRKLAGKTRQSLEDGS